MKNHSQPWLPEQICYCSNVHPGESVNDINDVVSQLISGVRKQRGLNRMYAGLWISAGLANSLHTNEIYLKEFSTLLAENGIDLVTLNGFPFGGFHEISVKEQVYIPAWDEQRRVDYTKQLAQILSHNLPDREGEGTISTVPVAYRKDWTPEKHQNALNNLCLMTAFLHELYIDTGKHIRLCLEMEPGCVLERTDEIIYFFNNELEQAAKQLNIDAKRISAYLGICYDICHQAVMFEETAESLCKISDAGITLGKIQISSAMHIQHPGSTETEIILSDFAEPRYLHQVRTINKNNELIGYDDLVTAISDKSFPRINPWRVHFHVPVQSEILSTKRLQTTQNEIRKVFDFLQLNPELHPHLEVETYTWQVLPGQLRPSNDEELINGLKGELDWVESELRQRNLLGNVTSGMQQVKFDAP